MPLPRVTSRRSLAVALAAAVLVASFSACGNVRVVPPSAGMPEAAATAVATATAAPVVRAVAPMPDLAVPTKPEIAEMLKPLSQFNKTYGDPPTAKAGRIRIPRIGVDAPIDERKAPANLDLSYIYQLGPSDVIWYDLSASPGHGGEPGGRGNAVLSAHVDYNYSVRWTGGWYTGPGVFAGLGSLQPDDAIEITFKGRTSRYSVVWEKQVPDATDWAEVYSSDVPEGSALTLISCTGNFNPATLEYDQRTLVRARLWTPDGGASASRPQPTTP